MRPVVSEHGHLQRTMGAPNPRGDRRRSFFCARGPSAIAMRIEGRRSFLWSAGSVSGMRTHKAWAPLLLRDARRTAGRFFRRTAWRTLEGGGWLQALVRDCKGGLFFAGLDNRGCSPRADHNGGSIYLIYL